MEFSPLRFDDATLAAYCALFAACFPGNDKFTPAYLNWLYRANPDGTAVGYDAWQDGRLAAHYVCVPARAHVHGLAGRVLLSLNTATHPDFQGKGLFTKLAELTYAAGAEQGFKGIYGVANANSTPGFIRKLGFQLVRPLEARIGVGRLHIGDTGAGALAFERCWDQASLAWRCSNPHNPVHVRKGRVRWQFSAAALGGKGVPAYAELRPPTPDFDKHAGDGSISPLRLFIGLMPDRSGSYWNYVSIPQRLRPSPLNLIYRALDGDARALDPAAIRFNFLDFDAY